jgi:hypothetical protein
MQLPISSLRFLEPMLLLVIFVVLPTAAFTGATGGTLAYSTDGETEDIPIGKAFTAVADQPILFVTNGALCYPLSVTL